VETTSGGGTLSVFVINSLGKPISMASVHITNNSVNPNIDVTLQTDQNGYLILPGAPPCAACYHVTVTKEAYSTDKTYTTDEVANPDKKPFTVTANYLTESTFMIEPLASLTLTSYSGEQVFTLAPNSIFRLTGSKTIGLDDQDNPVFKFDQTLSTGSSGVYTNNQLEWDTYILTVPYSTAEQITAVYPHQPMSIPPGSKFNLAVSTLPLASHSLLLNLEDASGSAVASASALLKLAEQPVASISSGLLGQPNFGQAFFNTLTSGSFAFTITHPEYLDLAGSILVNGITTDKLIMTKK